MSDQNNQLAQGMMAQHIHNVKRAHRGKSEAQEFKQWVEKLLVGNFSSGDPSLFRASRYMHLVP